MSNMLYAYYVLFLCVCALRLFDVRKLPKMRKKTLVMKDESLQTRDECSRMPNMPHRAYMNFFPFHVADFYEFVENKTSCIYI